MSNAVINTFLHCYRNDDTEDDYLKESKHAGRIKNVLEPKKNIFHVFSIFILGCWWYL